jgi:hypothetical protein
MLTNVYRIEGTPQVTLSIKELIEQSGRDKPLPSDLENEGGTGPLFLFCVDVAFDFSGFCISNGYNVLTTSPFEADDSRYNSNYRIEIEYRPSDTFVLNPAF